MKTYAVARFALTTNGNKRIYLTPAGDFLPNKGLAMPLTLDEAESFVKNSEEKSFLFIDEITA